MKKILLSGTLCTLLLFHNTNGQSFTGLNTGNYAGISGVMLQPASIVDSRFKFDINLFSTDVNFSNNYFLLDRDVILKFNKNNFDNYAEFKSKYLSQAGLAANEKMFFNINNRTQFPLSFMATTGKKSAIALNFQSRSKIQGRGITTDLAQLAFNNFYPSTTNTTIDASGLAINSLNWAEVGLTYGRVLYSSGNHFIKGAFTAKYLGGIASLNLASNDLRLRLNNDSSFNFNTSNADYNHNKNADFDMVFDKNFRPDANAFGFDAGLVYEYRGNLDRFKYIKNNDEKSYLADRRDVNKYVAKLGVSLLDVGMFKFDNPANVNSFSANINNWDIRNAHYKTLRDFDTALTNRVIANPNSPRTYNVYLPSALSVQLDVRFVKGLFLNVMSYNPVKIGSDKGQRFDKYGYYSITPRYERRHFGIYLPYTISSRNDLTDYKQHTLGATVRLGPLFVGSSNLGTMLFNNNLSAADVHVGLKVGITYGKPNKANRFISKVFVKDEDNTRERMDNDRRSDNDETSRENNERYEQRKREMANNRRSYRDTVIRRDTGRLIMNYNNGNIYANPDEKGNIIIINNYYNSNSPLPVRKDTVVMQSTSPMYADSIAAQRANAIRLQNKKIADSIAASTNDSLNAKRIQLDSLIRSMQKLQMQMDSSKNSLQQRNNNYQPGKDSYQKLNDSVVLVYKNVQPGDSVKIANATSQPNKDKQEVDRIVYDTVFKKKVNGNIGQPQQAADTVFIYRRYDDAYNRQPLPAKNSNTRMSREEAAQARTIQRMQERQDKQFEQYAAESARLSRDIAQLNERLLEAQRYQRGSNTTTYVPIASHAPRYNYESQPAAPVATYPVAKDTVYIRDQPASKPVLAPYKTDTVINTIVTPAQSFDYANMPAEIILFDVGKSSLLTIYKPRLMFIADLLLKNTDMKASVSGHTDPTGPAALNQKLSLQRAKAVSDFLQSTGVRESQLIVTATASTDPAVPGRTEVANSQNRRVEVKFEPTKN